MVKESVGSINFKRPESIFVVIYTVDGQSLLLKRVRPIFWQSVTGSLEWHSETPEDAARREVFEETGIQATTGWINWHITKCFPINLQYREKYAPGTTINHEHMFSLQLDEPYPVYLNSDEHTASEWCSLISARKKVGGGPNRLAIDQVIELNKGNSKIH